MSCLLDPSKARVGKLWPCHLFLKTQFHRNIAMPTCWHDFPGSSGGNEFACNAGDPGLISESGRFPGKENGNLLQYFCLENSMDRGAWWPQPMGPKRVEHNWVILSATWSQRMLTWNKVDLIGVEISRRTEWILGDKIWRTCLWISSVQSLSYVRLFVTPWTAARLASLSFTISWSLLKFMSIK